MPGESSVFDRIAAYCKSLRLDMSASEAAAFVEKNGTTPEQLGAIVDILNYLDAKKHESVINTLLCLSRLPVKAPKTFDNYEFERIQGKDGESVRNLRLLLLLFYSTSLYAVYGGTDGGANEEATGQFTQRATCSKISTDLCR